MAAKTRGDTSAGADEATVTILHVSDMQFGIQHRFGRLGLGGADEPFDTLLRRLTDDLDLLREDEGIKPDLVALTGDLAEWAMPKEYADVLQFCEGVQQHLGLTPDRILLIPGNHDINRKLCLAYFSEQEGIGEQPMKPWSPDGTRLASGSYDKTVRLWEAGTGKALGTCEGHTRGVQSVAWSPDGAHLASASDDHTMRTWEAWTGKALGTFEGHTHWVLSVAWSPDGTRLASGSGDKTVRLWEAETGKALGTFEGHTHWVLSVAWSPDGTRLASGSVDHTVRLWEVATGKPLAVFLGHLGPVTSVSWSRDSRFVVSSGSDGTLRIWDAATGHCLAVYVATPDGAVVYRPSDGHYRTQGDPAGRVAYTFGLARYELGELDEFVEGGLRLPEGEPLVPL